MTVEHPIEISTEILKNFFCAGLEPPPDFNVWQWSDKFRMIPRVSSSEPGLWRTSRVPYTREIMEELSPSSPAERVVLMKGAQIAGTEIGLNWLHYIIDHTPGPILAVQPTIEIAKRYSKQRLGPSFESCKRIRDKIIDNTSRASGNTILQKDFPGGTLIIGGGNSAASLRSMPICYLLLDEVDAMTDDADGEGDPLELAIRRTSTFGRRKIFILSTPTIAEMSRIEKEFAESDQRYFYIPCPFCKKYQVIKWANIKYENRDPDTARLICVKCKADIHERHKTDLLARGEWVKHDPSKKNPGFHLSSLYSPLGWYSWRDAVRDHLKAQTDPKKRQVWINTVLGEVWEIEATTIDPNWLEKKCEKYNAAVPGPVLVLSAGVDVQDDRLEISVYGYCLEEESYLIEHKIFFGDPARGQVWADLDNFLKKSYAHENGGEIWIAIACIDAMGHHTDQVYHFCKDRQFRKIFAIQGKAGPGRPIIGRVTKTKRFNNYLFQIGVDQAKGTLYSRLKIKDPGPGYIHFPKGTDIYFFQQLTAEKRVLKKTTGLPKLVWTLPPSKRNEALDCAVYSMAGLQILNPNLDLLAKENLIYNGKPNNLSTTRKRRVYSKGRA